MDPRAVLEHEAEVALEAAKARVRAAVDAATAEVLAGIGTSAREVLAATARASRKPTRKPRGKPRSLLTRTDATREFGVTTSVLRTMERHGEVHARRKGGRIMLDRDEVAAALKAKGHVVDLTAEEPAPASAE